MPNKSLGKQDADLLAALELAHLALVKRVGNVETLEKNGGVGFSVVAVLVADHAFKLAEPGAVGVGEIGLLVDMVALLDGGPERLVAHDDGVDDSITVEFVLILLEHAELVRADDCALLGVDLAGEDLHKGGLARAVGSG